MLTSWFNETRSYCSGYRDAECGWVVVEEEKDETDDTNFDKTTFKRKALFLVIYAPKRGILEVCLCILKGNYLFYGTIMWSNQFRNLIG